MSAIRLVVQGDDLGMCHAVNEGIIRAFDSGILTQTVAMAPCPWVDEGARMAADRGIPVGMHSTLTAEWDHLRWRPFSDGASLRGPDGTFHRLLRTAMEEVDSGEACAELEAQAEHLLGLGLSLTHVDMHMGPVCPEAYAHVCQSLDRRFLYPFVEDCYTFASANMLSHRDADAKLAWLLSYLDELAPGDHLLVTHPGVAGAELSALARPDAENVRWADEYRGSDLAVLTDPAVRKRIDERGIELATVTQLA